jgi:hypothetical protein
VRVATGTRTLDVVPGSAASVVVEVVNTGEVIDGVTARVIGLPEQFVSSQPKLLPLFPDATGQLTLSLAVPQSHPAGRHALTVEVVSHGARLPSQFVDVDLDVAARPALQLGARPRVIRARRSARFVLELTNGGNVPLEVTMRAVDVDRASTSQFMPETVRIEAGAVAPVLLTVRGPRTLTGSEMDRAVTVEATALRADRQPEDVASEAALSQSITVRLRQRPLISRGLLTALILASIVALWAGVFLLGLTKVFSNDPMTKQAPASFFAAAQTSPGGGGGTAGGGDAGGAQGAAPAGALPKTGQLPPGLGSEISGAVTATTDQQPVGRILVQAWRLSPSGPKLVSSAATQGDGTYTLAGLFPMSYYLEFSATGFTTTWYPAAAAQSGAQAVSTAAQGATTGANVVIKGEPASISGTVNPGDTLTPVRTTVVARPLLGAATSTAAATATTSAAGAYTLPNLPAPASYQISFTTPGYQTTTIVDTVNGGDSRLEPTVTIGASQGQISGVVSDGNNPLGGATVATTVGGRKLTVMTPTTGQVGAFVLGNLPTPATYVITFSAPGHGTNTTIIDLAAGQSRTDLKASLASGTGSVTGRLVDSNGNGLGGATVTVGGATATDQGVPAPGASTDPTGATPSSPATPAGTSPRTTTLTSGSVGTFAISGLLAPGSYTLTFTLDGYAPATVPVTLTENGAPPVVTVTLSAQLGGITGAVTGPGGVREVGATVSATNGAQTWTSTSSAPGGALPAGGYLITGLQPGTYSVTVSGPGLAQQTAMVTVVAGRTSTQNLQLGKLGA